MKHTSFGCVLLSFVLVAGVSYSGAQPSLDYDAQVQQGTTELQAGHSDQALRSGQAAIKMSANRWEGYALAGGALMDLRRYEEAADALSKAIERAPETKQPTLRELRRRCLQTPQPTSAQPAKTEAPVPTTQAEIVLWKSIENSANAADFQAYLDQYPQGTFAGLARRHFSEAQFEAMAKGSHLIFVWKQGEDLYQLRSADLNGNNVKILLQSRKPISSPVWCSNGQKLIYVSYENGKREVFEQALQTGMRRLRDARLAGGETPLSSADCDKAVQSASAEEQVTAGVTSRARASPEGDLIALIEHNGDSYEAVVRNLASRNRTVIAQGNVDGFIALSPNKSLIAYSGLDVGGGALRVISLDGQAMRTVEAGTGGEVRDLAWGP
jgi:tetratricopeptide (TPR) repeat protein